VDVGVTGSRGLIGEALVASLTADGHRVIRFVRGDATGADLVPWDPEAGRLDPTALGGLDAVVHLAGEGIGERRWSTDQKRRIKDSRTKGTTLLAEAMAGRDGGPRVLVSGSAIGIYGDRGDEWLPEDSPPGDGFLAEVATAWEAAVSPAQAAGVRVARIRTGIVLSAEGGALGKQLPLFRFGAGGRMGNGRQYMSWISLVDEVRAIRWLLDHDVSGPVNLAAPTPVTNAVFGDTLGTVLHRPTILPVPKAAPRLLLGREMADELLFASQRVEPAVLTSAGFTFEHPTLEPALRHALDRT